MAAGTLPAPGTRHGPCPQPCGHKDCATTRRDAEQRCRYCFKPIGYDTPFFRESPAILIHEECAYREADELRG